MAIKFKNVSTSGVIKKLDLTIKEKEITSIIGEYDELEFIKLLKGDIFPISGTLKIDGQPLIKEMKKEYNKKVYVC